LSKGFVHVYTGNGKGKTTASLGFALRALGHGFSVYMIQFLKGKMNYGELKASKRFPDFKIVQYGRAGFVVKGKPTSIDVELAEKGLQHAKEIVRSGRYNIVILDEVNVAIHLGLIQSKDIVELIKSKPSNVELILTGRYASEEVFELADYVTEMVEVKHPYKKDVRARLGVEY